jgi:uncharacterized protein
MSHSTPPPIVDLGETCNTHEKPRTVQSVFGRPRVLLPVIHLPFGWEAGRREVEVARDAGADGVFLIAQGMGWRSVRDLADELQAHMPSFFVGVNLLLRDTKGAIWESYGARGVWVDNAGADSLDPVALADWQAFVRAKRTSQAVPPWEGLYFGGVAFKGQPPVPSHLLGDVARAASTYVDVVTTSGEWTGVPADLRKVQLMREAIPGHSLALASGVRPENVERYLPYVDAYLVATGIEKDFGVLDPVRTKQLADKIHGWSA